MSRTAIDDVPLRARIPADLDAPDRVMLGLTTRQVAVLAAAAVPVYLGWQQLAGRVPVPVLIAVTGPVAALAAVIALGRRDGVSLDAWLLAALVHRRNPRRLQPTPGDVPDWAPASTPARSKPTGRVGVLRLPAWAIADDGSLTTRSTAVALVATTTVTANLNTATEQAAQVGAFARWLNALTGPVQIVVSARQLDLGARAERIAEQAHALTSPTLAATAVDHAWFLLDLMEAHDPLERVVTIACTAPTTGRSGTGTGGREALRRAAATADALSAVGVSCRVLDAAEATAVLTAAADPYTGADATRPRTPPDTPVTTTEPAWWDDLPDDHTVDTDDDEDLEGLDDEPPARFVGQPAVRGAR